MKKTILILWAALALSGCQRTSDNTFKEIHPPFAANSPAVIKLLNANKASQDSAMQNLWQRLQDHGAPLVGPDPHYDDHVYITFLYRNATPHIKVWFDVFGKYDEYRLGDYQLYRLRDTDLYYRSYTMPADICFSYRFIIEDTLTGNRTVIADPLNRNPIPIGNIHSFSWSVLDLAPLANNLNTEMNESTGSSIDTLQFYSDIMDNTRNIYIWLPPGYDRDKQTPYPVIYLFDSSIYLDRIETPNILDHLISQGDIAPMVAVLIDNPTNTSRKTELPLNADFMAFITTELVPYIRFHHNVSFSPDKNIIGGMSYGGLAGAYIAWHHPEMFGKVMSQSGSFWRGPELADQHGNELRDDWLPRQIQSGDIKNLTLYLDWGLQENMVLSSNRKLVEILDNKGYALKYTEFNGWHDWSNSRKTFPEGLQFLLGQ